MMHCSVIIPHFNQTKHLVQCLRALNEQEKENLTFDVTVVDNNSDEDVEKAIKPFNVKLIRVSEAQNPYVCRNIGIESTGGEVLGFLDAKCIPEKKWLISGIKKTMSFDLVAGAYAVDYDESLSSMVFPLMYLNNTKNIKKNYGVSGGNLFVKRKVFDQLGLFNVNSKSGNDILFTKTAISAGVSIGMAENAKVRYPTKDIKTLRSDVRKYGRGAAITGQKKIKDIVFYLFPMRIKTFKEAIDNRQFQLSFYEMVKLWLYVWRTKIEFALGAIYELVKPFERMRPNP